MFKRIFNLWRDFKKEKPKKNGWYTCTVEVKGQQRYVRELYWKGNHFKDNIREEMLLSYYVYSDDICTNPIQKRLTPTNTRNLVYWTDSVVAWKKRPKAYMRGFVMDEFYF